MLRPTITDGTFAERGRRDADWYLCRGNGIADEKIRQEHNIRTQKRRYRQYNPMTGTHDQSSHVWGHKSNEANGSGNRYPCANGDRDQCADLEFDATHVDARMERGALA